MTRHVDCTLQYIGIPYSMSWVLQHQGSKFRCRSTVFLWRPLAYTVYMDLLKNTENSPNCAPQQVRRFQSSRAAVLFKSLRSAKNTTPLQDPEIKTQQSLLFGMAQGDLKDPNWYGEPLPRLRCVFFFHLGKWYQKKPQQTFGFVPFSMGRISSQFGHWGWTGGRVTSNEHKNAPHNYSDGRNAQSYRSYAGCTFLTARRPKNSQE